MDEDDWLGSRRGTVHKGLESIYRGHRSGLFALAMSVTRSRGDAEDAVHDAFAKLCRANGTAGGDSVAYVFAAVRNAAIDRVRKRQRRECCPILLEPCLEAKSDDPESGDRDRLIAKVVDALPEELRTVVVLHLFCNMNFRQIGEIENLPLQTVWSRYRNALEKMRPKLKDFL
jgi:RNA polymerase sigma-70 factor, ECF subfamily